MTQWILAPNGRPFRDRDAARIKRNLLFAELGESVPLEVVPHPTGGFAVTVGGPDIEERAHSDARSSAPDTDAVDGGAVGPRESLLRAFEPVSVRALTTPSKPNDPPGVATGSASSISDRYAVAFRLSPAVRAFVGLHLQALAGATLLLAPHLVFLLTGLHLPSNSTASALILTAIAGCGAFLSILSLSRFLWTYTANTYVVDATGVEQVQWYFDKGRLRRRAPRVNFAHLRSADVDQSVLQMMLNVGSVKLAAGATDNYEVVLRHVARPRELQREFQRRLHHTSGPPRPAGSSSDL